MCLRLSLAPAQLLCVRFCLLSTVTFPLLALVTHLRQPGPAWRPHPACSGNVGGGCSAEHAAPATQTREARRAARRFLAVCRCVSAAATTRFRRRARHRNVGISMLPFRTLELGVEGGAAGRDGHLKPRRRCRTETFPLSWPRCPRAHRLVRPVRLGLSVSSSCALTRLGRQPPSPAPVLCPSRPRAAHVVQSAAPPQGGR